MSLKDGTSTNDPRLDRLQHFDPRSRNYPVRTLVADVKVPRSYTWSVPFHLDQGQEGACVGFSFAHDAAARPASLPWITNAHARILYFTAQQEDQWDGGEYPGAMPVYSGTSVIAGAKASIKYSLFPEYRWGFSLMDAILGIGFVGPVIFGFNWRTGMFEPDNKGFIHPTGVVEGGHAILGNQIKIVTRNKAGAIDYDASYVNLWNSWGSNWGMAGSAKINLTELDLLLKDNGECCIPVERYLRPPDFGLAA